MTKLEQVVEVVNEAGGPITGADVAARLGYNSPQSISGVLTAAWRAGSIKRIGRGLYRGVGATPVGTIGEARAKSQQNIETTVNGDLLRTGDMFEFIAKANSGRLVLRQIDTQSLFVAETLDA
jgi:hypothetical protein